MTSHDRAFIERTATALDLDPTPWRAVAISRRARGPRGVRWEDPTRTTCATRPPPRGTPRSCGSAGRETPTHISPAGFDGGGACLQAAPRYGWHRSTGRPRPNCVEEAHRRFGGCRFSRHTKFPSPAMTSRLLFPRAMRTTTGGTHRTHAQWVSPWPSAARRSDALHRPPSRCATAKHLLVAGPNGSGKTTLLGGSHAGPRTHGCVDAASGRPRAQVLQAATPVHPENAWHLGIGGGRQGFVPQRRGTSRSVSSPRETNAGHSWRSRPTRFQILVIGEPTNYLDLNALESSKRQCASGRNLVISTHDEWLITRWWGRIHQLGRT